jgi:hypothetical protein
MCGNGKYQDEIGEPDCKDLDQCTQTYISASEAGVVDANPCGKLGDVDAVCVDAVAPLTGNNCSCSDEREWESLYANLDPGVGEAVCNQKSLLVKSSMQIGGSITQANFVLGMTEAIIQQIEADPEFEEAQRVAQQNALVPVDPDQPPVEIRVTRYETTVRSAATVPGTPDEYDAGDPIAIPAVQPTAKYTSLVYGLTAAACGNLTNDMCSVTQVGVARRRRVQEAAASTTTVSFVVTASIDISDNVDEDTFATAFVNAIANEPNGALTSISADDISIAEPDISTEIVYVIVATDTAASTSAARTMTNDAAVQTALSEYTDSPITVAISCKNCDSIIEKNTATPIIVYVIVFFVLLSLAWVAGAFVYGRQTGAATMIKKIETVVGAVANPMFDAVEGAVDVTTAVVTETVDATAGTAVRQTGKTAKKAGKKAAKTTMNVANPMYDGDEDED